METFLNQYYLPQLLVDLFAVIGGIFTTIASGIAIYLFISISSSNMSF